MDANSLAAYLAIAGLVVFAAAFQWFVNRDLYRRAWRYFGTRRASR